MKKVVVLAILASATMLVMTGCSKPEDKALETAAPPVANPKKESKPAGFVQPTPPPTMGTPGEKKGKTKTK